MYRKISQSVKYFFWCYLIGNQLLIGADDFESRNTISYQVKLPQSFKIDFEQSLRLRGNEFSFRQTFTEAAISYKVSDDLKNKVEALISDRNDAKSEKNFELADSIRNELNELGIEIKDTSDGTSWNIKS